MPLALDASTPAAATANAQTVTTASFTPPAGAVLCAVVLHATNSSIATRASTLTDSTGLTWTAVVNTPLTSPSPGGSLARLYTAVVAVSQAMTVTTTITTNGFNGVALRTLVYTGADTTTRVEGAVAGSSNGAVISQSISTATDGGIPWLASIDWNGGAAPTPGTGVTTDTSYQAGGGADRMWIATRAAISPAGSATINSTAPATGLNAWVAFAVKPAAAAASPPSRSAYRRHMHLLTR